MLIHLKNLAITAFFVGINLLAVHAQIKLKSGDFMLVAASNNSLSKAIDRVTKQDSSTHYSHIALVEKKGDSTWILHAAPEHGSERLLLDDYLIQRKEQVQIDVYRLKKPFRKSIKPALVQAKKLLGKPYNFSYILNDDSYYCSDFVARSFAKDSIFQFNPMTFVNPETHEIDAVWVNYYQQLNLQVPEGKPGCNPNGMAISDKIYFVGQLKP